MYCNNVAATLYRRKSAAVLVHTKLSNLLSLKSNISPDKLSDTVAQPSQQSEARVSALFA